MRAKADEELNGKSSHHHHEDYRVKYKNLKKKLKFLLHVSWPAFRWNFFSRISLFQENEFFRESLKTSQKRLIKLSRDKRYLLDRLLKYERPENFSDCSDSDDQVRKRKPAAAASSTVASIDGGKQVKRKRAPQKDAAPGFIAPVADSQSHLLQMDRLFTTESREFQSLDTEMFSRDVPAEMFSSESNDNSNIDDEYINLA